jgi:AcrR family transcriptional regulator
VTIGGVSAVRSASVDSRGSRGPPCPSCEAPLARPKTPKERDAGGRERLLRAATRLFAAKGYAATTVRDILRAAGVTAPVLYYHFGNKEGVFLALAREGVGKVEAALQEALGREGTAAERVRGFCHAMSAVRREYVNVAWVVDAILSGPPEAAPHFDLREMPVHTVRQLAELIRGGIETGEFRDVDPLQAALALSGAVEITARARVYEPLISSAEEQLDGMLSVILAGLSRSPA